MTQNPEKTVGTIHVYVTPWEKGSRCGSKACLAVTYLDPKGPASIDPHNTFAHSVIQEAIGGAYCQASGHPPPSNRTQLAWLESAATAAVHRNLTFQSVTPNRPFVFHHGESPSHGSTLVNNRFTRVYPPDSRAQTKKDEEATAKTLGLERTATGWKYKEGTLVPGKNGQIVGIQKPTVWSTFFLSTIATGRWKAGWRASRIDLMGA